MQYGNFQFGNYGHEDMEYSKMSSSDVIKLLDLSPLPGEGGYFKEILKSNETASISSNDAERYKGNRSNFTLINYLMTKEQFSALHALKSDEAWNYIAGAAVEICIINPNSGDKKEVILDVNNPFQVVPKDHIFGARILTNDIKDFSLVTCEVRPGFEYEDFILIDPKQIIIQYPQLIDTVRCFTRSSSSFQEVQAPFLAQNPDLQSNESQAHFTVQ